MMNSVSCYRSERTSYVNVLFSHLFGLLVSRHFTAPGAENVSTDIKVSLQFGQNCKVNSAGLLLSLKVVAQFYLATAVIYLIWIYMQIYVCKKLHTGEYNKTPFLKKENEHRPLWV